MAQVRFHLEVENNKPNWRGLGALNLNAEFLALFANGNVGGTSVSDPHMANSDRFVAMDRRSRIALTDSGLRIWFAL